MGSIGTWASNSWPPALRTDPGRFAQYRARVLGNDPRSFAALTRAYLGIALAPLYPQVHCPVLVVGCSGDAIKPPADCAKVAAAIAHGRFVEADSGHFISLQAPELFLRLLEEFMEDLA